MSLVEFPVLEFSFMHFDSLDFCWRMGAGPFP